MLAAGCGCRHITILAAASSDLNQVKLPDIPGYSGLRNLESGLLQIAQKILLPVDCVLLDQFKNFVMAFTFHRRYLPRNFLSMASN